MTLPDITPSRRQPLIPDLIRLPRHRQEQPGINPDDKCLKCPFQQRCDLDPIYCPILPGVNIHIPSDLD